MPTRARADQPLEEPPTIRTCGTDQVHERLLRTVPGYAQARSEIENRTGRMLFALEAMRTGCTEIPVVVHVVSRNATEDISMAQVQSQIQVLNADYRASNADRSTTPPVFQPLIGDARVTFTLASKDPDGNPTDGVTRTTSKNTSFNADTDDVKAATTGGADPWPSDKYLNLWVCGNLRDSQNHALLGYAQFPGGPAATDGVVILNTAFGTTGIAAAPFDLGRTATHEIGHWLNLRHIWGDDGTGCSGDDFVADTPNQGGPNFGVPTFPHVSCSNGPNGDLFMNYMDYVDDKVMVMFTAGQVARMQAALDSPRSSIGTTGPCGGKPIKEHPKDLIKEPVKEQVKDLPKDPLKDHIKEGPKDPAKDHPKDLGKEPIKEQPKDLAFDPPKGAFDPPKGPFDPPKVALDPPGPPGPGPGPGPIGPGPAGRTPFVLGGAAPEQAAPQADPLVAVLQQLGAILAGYSEQAAAGRLDAAGTSRWQQLSSVYAQLVALLG